MGDSDTNLSIPDGIWGSIGDGPRQYHEPTSVFTAGPSSRMSQRL